MDKDTETEHTEIEHTEKKHTETEYTETEYTETEHTERKVSVCSSMLRQCSPKTLSFFLALF